jgi:hypothetical protein
LPCLVAASTGRADEHDGATDHAASSGGHERTRPCTSRLADESLRDAVGSTLMMINPPPRRSS